MLRIKDQIAYIGLATLALSLFSAGSYAAQDAVIIRDGAEVHAGPDAGSQLLHRFPNGQTVRISNQNQGGWYKVLISPGKMGWISGSDLRPGGAQPSAQAPQSQMSRAQPTRPAPGPQRRRRVPNHEWSIGVFGQFAPISPSELQTYSAATEGSVMEKGFGVEVGYHFSRRWAMYGHYSKLSSSAPEYTTSETMTLVLFGYDFMATPEWRVGFKGGLGFSSYELTSLNAVLPFTATSSLLTAMGKFSARYYLAPWVALQGELGYRYVTATTIPVSEEIELHANLSSPVIGLGVQFEF